jgi:hypothetical protein
MSAEDTETSPRFYGRESTRAVLDAIKTIIEPKEQMTIRHLFYRLVGARALDKTESEYKRLCSLLSRWRKAGIVPWDAFTDSTRWWLRDDCYPDLQTALGNMQRDYRRDLWTQQGFYVELWCEKDAIASILSSAASEWLVPVFVCRGFASLSSLYSAARTLRYHAGAGQHCVIGYFGDHDPSGLSIDASAARTLREEFNVSVTFKRLAILPYQIELFNLPTRPQKKKDTRAKDWLGECVEIDALEPRDLKSIAREFIENHINQAELEKSRQIERAERNTLKAVCGAMHNDGGDQ